MNLKSLIQTDLADKTARVMWRDGISFDIRFVNRPVMIRLAESCQAWVFDPTTKQRVKRIDPEKFGNAISRQIVVAWHDLTLRKLAALVPMKVESLDVETLDAPIPFTEENLTALVVNCPDLEEFLQTSAADVSLFQTINEEELRKNSLSSPSTT